jgi:hypothetical protein
MNISSPDSILFLFPCKNEKKGIEIIRMPYNCSTEEEGEEEEEWRGINSNGY